MIIDKRKIAIALPSLGEEEWLATKEPLMSGWLTQGPRVAEFESQFAKRHQVTHALATTSCTTGLHLILEAMDIGPGDEVIVPSFTWVATANVVLYCGAKPIFADIDLATFNLSPESVKSKINQKTKAIIAVHLFGLCAEMDELREVAGDIPIIEDAACAAGSGYKGTPAGGLGLAAAFSFHPRKSVTTGEGGMVTSNHNELAEKMNMLRNHGASLSEEQRHKGSQPYLLPDFNLLGFNYRMTDLQGAVGVVQLKKLDQFIVEREQWAQFYQKELQGLSWLRLPHVDKDYRHGWQSFVCLVDDSQLKMSRNEIMAYLQDKGVSTRPGTHAIHLLGFYKNKFSLKADDYPMALYADKNSMAIPLHNKMSAEDYMYVVQCLKEIK